MKFASDSSKVAIYWDFENLHAILIDRQNGEGAYRDNRFQVQPEVVNLKPVIEYAASLGDVIINKAYANWQWFGRYGDACNVTGTDLIQLFPRGKNMKNSADIRMALDCLSDIHAHPHLTHVLIVSSDSDFISLAQKAKQSGRQVVGVGIEGTSNRYWVSSCNEFKFYNLLVEEAGKVARKVDASSEVGPSDDASEPSHEQIKETLFRALGFLQEKSDDGRISRSRIKHVLKRLLPSFDEKILGFRTFTEFLASFPELSLENNDSGGLVFLTSHSAPEGSRHSGRE